MTSAISGTRRWSVLTVCVELPLRTMEKATTVPPLVCVTLNVPPTAAVAGAPVKTGRSARVPACWLLT